MSEQAPVDEAKDDPKVDPKDEPKAKDDESKVPEFDDEQQKYIDKLIGKTRTTEREKVKKQLLAEAENKKAEDEGEWEKLAASRQKKIEELEADIAQRDLSILRATIAKKHNIPDDVIDLIDGDDEETLDNNARRLSKVIARDEAPATELAKGTKPPKPKKPSDSPPAYRFGTTPRVPWPDHAGEQS